MSSYSIIPSVISRTIIYIKPLYESAIKSIFNYIEKYPVIVVSLYLSLVSNQAFWLAFAKLITGDNGKKILFSVSFFLFVNITIAILLNLIRLKYLFKPLLIVILISSSFASYFMTTYGVILDISMMNNIFETDYNESIELVNFTMMIHVLITGVIPALLVFKIKLKYFPVHKQLINNSLTIIILIALFSANFFLFSSSYISFFKNNHYARYLINPANYIYSLGKYVNHSISTESKTITKIGVDAHQHINMLSKPRKSVVVIVVGETARAKNFSLNGYKKKTNPYLEQNKDIYNYPNFYSCGTSTHVSLPCMFSKFNRSEFDEYRAKNYEKLPDVLMRAGLDVYWYDNNSGCKGVCKNIRVTKITPVSDHNICNGATCFDEVMLTRLDTAIKESSRDVVIFLHQQGSHGPAYYLRHPDNFTKFSPECKSSELNSCSREEIANAYDNTIAYTDYFIAQVISKLKKYNNTADTAMIYVSDHGESLGEHNLYLHSLPYMIAPDEQKHVPFIAWFSDNFSKDNMLDKSCLKRSVMNSYNHDYLFHSILGLTHVETELYQQELDMFQPCIKS